MFTLKLRPQNCIYPIHIAYMVIVCIYDAIWLAAGCRLLGSL